MRRKLTKARRAGGSLAVRGCALILWVATVSGLAVGVWYATHAQAREQEYRATTEAFLAAALGAHLENQAHLGETFDQWLRRIESLGDRLAWAGVLTPDGDGLEFRRRTSLPLDSIRPQIDFNLSEPTVQPLRVGGLPSQRLRLICVPQRSGTSESEDGSAMLAAIVDAGDGVAAPRLLFVWTIGLLVAGLASAFAWLHYGIIMPVRRATTALTSAAGGLTEATLSDSGPAELDGVAAALRDARREMNEWRTHARALESTIEKRVESRVRDATRARTQAERHADTDPLCGLANRRALRRELQRLVDVARAAEGELALAVIDVNQFKKFNDTRGHRAGDELLRFLGGLIGASTRKSVDVAARLGGDEFVLVLPDTSSADAFAILTRLAALFAQHVRTLDPPVPPPSLSCGVACLREHAASSPDRLIELADAAMYRAKRGSQPAAIVDGAECAAPPSG